MVLQVDIVSTGTAVVVAPEAGLSHLCRWW